MKPIKKTCLLCAGGVITYINVEMYAEMAERDRKLTALTDDEVWNSCQEKKICPYCILDN